MRPIRLLTPLWIALLFGGQLSAQDYWEWETLEQEWEYETDGLDYGYASIEYDFDEELSGEVIGLRRVSAGTGKPASVQLSVRGENGRTRTIQLGDVAYVRSNLPRLRQGDQVVLGGSFEEIDGRRVYHAKEIRSSGRRYMIPEYAYDQRLEGRLLNVRRVAMDDEEIESIIAKIRTPNGATIDVLLGSEQDLQRAEQNLRPGDRVEVDGYERTVEGDRRFVVQDVTIRSQQRAQQGEENQRQQVDRRQQEQDAESQQASRRQRNQP